MEIINIQEAKTHLSRLVEEVLQGKELVIAKSGKPLVKVVPFSPEKGKRSLGLLAGQVTEAKDCWAPDPELEAVFYGEEEPASLARVAEDPR